jgi:hypothetical protein
MIIAAAGPICVGVASARGSPGAWLSPRRGWGGIGGGSSAPGPGLAGGGGCGSVYERSSERLYALVLLACAVICFNTLQQPSW